jgi:hypothetical protein
MTTGDIVLLAIALTCCISAAVAYIAEFISLQTHDVRPRWIEVLNFIGLPVWLVIATIAVVFMSPIYLARWVREQSHKSS